MAITRSRKASEAGAIDDSEGVSWERNTHSTPEAPRKHYKGGIIGVASVSGAPTIPLIEYSVPPISEDVAAAFRKQIDALARRVHSAEGNIGTVERKVQTQATDLSKKLSSVTPTVKYDFEFNEPIKVGWAKCKHNGTFATGVYLHNRGINLVCHKIELTNAR